MAQLTGGPADALIAEEAKLLACVHCGFCLNACPTYTRLGHEADSPRGRLDLMRAVVDGRLDPDDPAFATHIDRCLGCRACEPVCPSGVPYGFLLERARTTIANASGVPFQTRVLIASFTGPAAPFITLASRLLRATRLPRLIARIAPARFGAVRFAMAMLASTTPQTSLLRAAPGAARTPHRESGRRPEPIGGTQAEMANPQNAFADPHAQAGGYPEATAAVPGRMDASSARPRVAVLTGCVQQALFARVNDATVRVLEANGCEVVEVPTQLCCGALDAHSGRLLRAQELARVNIAAFEAAGVDTIVVNAAGCGAMMKEYGEQLRGDHEWAERAEAVTRKVKDVAEYLVGKGIVTGGAVDMKVTFDAPCHLHHGQRIREAPLRLLDSVPGLTRVPLRDADECCGGAGLYGVSHPELGGRILGDKVAAIRETGATVCVTPNPGCMMQIGAGLLLNGSDVAVLHPIEILDESYRRAAPTENR